MTVTHAAALRSGYLWSVTWTPDLVQEATDKPLALAQYIEQRLGVPWPTGKDQLIFRKQVKEFFVHYPDVDYFTLCRLVNWCKSRNRRYGRIIHVIDEFREAWKAGALPELDPQNRDPEVEAAIARALSWENDPTWRRWLMGASGIEARRNALLEWRSVRAAT